MIVVARPEACTLCRLCELACSFHLTGAFSHHASCLRVNAALPIRSDQPRVCIGGAGRPACDSCRGEKQPLCVRICPEDVLAAGGKAG